MTYRVEAPILPPSLNERYKPVCTCQRRARATALARRGKRGPRIITTPEVGKFKKQFGLIARSQLREMGPPMVGDVAALVVLRGTRMDADNVVKDTFDALNGIAWQDDKQVKAFTVVKEPGERGLAVVFGPLWSFHELYALARESINTTPDMICRLCSMPDMPTSDGVCRFCRFCEGGAK